MLLQPGLLGRIRTLWTGVGATLLKDVPFAALYWSLLEPFKSRLTQAEFGGPSLHSQVCSFSLEWHCKPIFCSSNIHQPV